MEGHSSDGEIILFFVICSEYSGFWICSALPSLGMWNQNILESGNLLQGSDFLISEYGIWFSFTGKWLERTLEFGIWNLIRKSGLASMAESWESGIWRSQRSCSEGILEFGIWNLLQNLHRGICFGNQYGSKNCLGICLQIIRIPYFLISKSQMSQESAQGSQILCQ